MSNKKINKKDILTRIFIIILTCGQYFLACLPVRAVGSDIIISEIGAYEKSDFEWVEIYNRGSAAINLTGWKFYEDTTKHGLTAFSGDLIIEAGEYAIIADVAQNFKNEYPEFIGTIIDSSWTTLNLDGEEIGLVDNSGVTIELFTYLTSSTTSLQRIDLTSDDFTVTNWQVHESGNSAGRVNEFYSNTTNEDPNATNNSDYTPISGNGSTPLAINDSENDYSPIEGDENQIELKAGDILINEIVASPAEDSNEWIELFNSTDFDIDLTGAWVEDGSGTKQLLTGVIKAGEYLLIDDPKCALNNSGDQIILKSGSDEIIGQLTYGNWNDGDLTNNWPAAKSGESLALFEGEFKITTVLTPNAENILSSPIVIVNQDQTITETKTTTATATIKSNIIINELLPNPIGPDTNEWIELKNISDQSQILNNYKITDKENTAYVFSATIPGNGFYLIEKSASCITLNNYDSETLTLFNSDDKQIDKVSYDKNFSEGFTYAALRLSSGLKKYFISLTATPGQENIIQQLPVINLNCPSKINVGEKLICDLSDSYDPDGEKLTFVWEIGPQIFIGEILNITFDTKGAYEIKITASDNQSQSIKNHKLTVGDANKSEMKITSPKMISGAKKTASTSAQSIPVNTDETAEFIKGETIITQGIVVVPPNLFGKTTAYIDGLQLYYSKTWPNLNVGDLISVNGKISTATGPIKLNIAKDGIKILDQNQTSEAFNMLISEIDNPQINRLIQTSGQIVEKSKTQLILADNDADIIAVIKTGTKISLNNFNKDQRIKITGIISQDKDEKLIILPRFQTDLESLTLAAPTTSDYIAIAANNKSGQVIKYLAIGGGTAIISLIGLVIKKRKT